MIIENSLVTHQYNYNIESPSEKNYQIGPLNFRKVITVQPSSAAAERVFSLLSNSFTKRQTSSLEDYMQLSVMLQCDRH